ncbi:MAG: DJ-1/PfpI family protein [Clostridia bacterium]|nr:DJ-1/PfpI family protein [Clostridia bacterium]
MVYLFLADGFEETEALAPLDCIRRAGISILTVGVGEQFVTSSKRITVKADITDQEIDLTQCDGVILPGGMPGTENLYASETVRSAVAFCAENNKMVAAICAAPSILGRMGLLDGKRAVCFPGFEQKLGQFIPSEKAVETDGIFITAKGAGCVFPFAHSIISYLKNKESADTVLRQMQYAQM